MGLFDRLRGRGPGGGGGRRGTLDRSSHRGDLSHLEQFVATQPVEQPHGVPPVVVCGVRSDIVIFPTLGGATALRAAPFPEWQDEGGTRPLERDADDCIEEHP